MPVTRASQALQWIPIQATLTYSSADDPTYVVSTSVDLTAVIGIGMRIKFTNNGVTFYGIVTAITSNSITLYGGTDYDVANLAITAPYFSPYKAPIGFPLDPDKWSVETSSSSSASQGSPVQNTWYNAYNIVLPIGAWVVNWWALGECYISGSAANIDLQITLSTANNSESDTELGATFYMTLPTTTGLDEMTWMTKGKCLTLASKTTYYLNYRTTLASVTTIVVNSTRKTTVIRAVCAYL